MASINDSEITEGLVREQADYLQKVWDKTHAKFRDIDQYITLTFPLWDSITQRNPATRRPEYRPSTPRAVVDHAADTQFANIPVVTCTPIKAGQAIHEQRADLKEKFLKSVFLDASLMEPQLPFKQAFRNLITYGYTTLEAPIFDASKKPILPVQRKGESDEEFELRNSQYKSELIGWNPFRIRCHNPTRVLLDPYEKNPDFAIKRIKLNGMRLKEMTMARAEQTEGIEIWEPGKDPWKPIPIFEYWTCDKHAVIAYPHESDYRGGYSSGHGELIISEDNPWGFVPFVQAFSGWGADTVDGDEDPADLASGILDYIRGTLKAQAQMRTAMQQAVHIAAWGKIGTRKGANEAAAQLSGDILHDSDPDDYWWLRPPDIPSWVLQEGSWVDSDIEQGTFSSAIFGMRDKGVVTVGQQAILSNAALKKFASPSMQIDYMSSVIASNILRLVEANGETLTVRQNSLKVADVDKNYTADVRFEILDPVLHLQEKEFAMREVQTGLRSKESYWEISRTADISTERDRLLDDMFESDPRVREKLIEAYARGRRLDDMVAQATEASGQPPGGGGAPMQQPMQPPSGEPIATPMGEPTAGLQGEGLGALNELREPLSAQTAKPSSIIPYDVS